MNAWLLGLGSDAVDTITDVVGITAVLAALVLLLVVETRRSSGRARSTLLNRSAVGVTLLALVIIGGRFQWIPAAGEGEGSGETAASVREDADDPTTTTSTTTTATAAGPDAPTSSLAGPPTPPTDPATSPTTVADEPRDTGDDPDAGDPSVDDPAVTTTLVGPPAPGPDADEAPAVPVAPSGDDVETHDGPRGPPTTYEVAEGDNFWTIAASVLEAETDGPVSDGEIHGYWLELIDANADQLVEPGNPDLILPGQLLDVPPVGGASP